MREAGSGSGDAEDPRVVQLGRDFILGAEDARDALLRACHARSAFSGNGRWVYSAGPTKHEGTFEFNLGDAPRDVPPVLLSRLDRDFTFDPMPGRVGEIQACHAYVERAWSRRDGAGGVL